jgi:hypothetical protein
VGTIASEVSSFNGMVCILVNYCTVIAAIILDIHGLQIIAIEESSRYNPDVL